MKKEYVFVVLMAMAIGCLPVPAARAASSDAMIEGAKQCTRLLPQYERKYGIPIHLLAAISSTESGRWHDGLQISLPWPWTINDGEQGHYYKTKAEAVAAAKRLIASGKKSFDVGCMQVNMYHHGHAFSSIEDAFEPEHNVRYAASFLRSLYEESKSWRRASAAYHSKTPQYGARYVAKVYERWHTIIGRVRMARATLADTTGNRQYASLTTDEQFSATESATKPPAPKIEVVTEPKKIATTPPPADALVVTNSPDIEVTPGVIPVTLAQPLQLADAGALAAAQQAEEGEQPQQMSRARMIRTDGVKQSVPANGPRFIFND